MLAPLLHNLKKRSYAPVLRHIYAVLEGVAADFWKDGTELPFGLKKPLNHFPPAFHFPKIEAALRRPAQSRTGIWHAQAGEVAEKLWGDGQILPGGDAVDEMLLKPLNITKGINVLDLSAGLGARCKIFIRDFKAQVTAMESDAAIAARATEIFQSLAGSEFAGITAFKAEQLALTKNFDALLARELFYRVPDKENFLRQLASHANPAAQVSFTDYVVDPENYHNAAVRAWRAKETDAAPLGLVEMAEVWAKAGFNLRVYDDQTEFYKSEIVKGFKRLVVYLAQNKPDQPTKQEIMRHLESWALRMAAIQQGMKFYRIHGLKV